MVLFARHQNAFLFFAVLASAVLFQCAVEKRDGPSGKVDLEFPPEGPAAEATLKFSHKLHIESEMECTECHGEKGKISLPSERGKGSNCLDCHEDEIGERDKPGKDCSMCHLAPDRKVRWPQSPRLQGLVFDHKKHGKLDCLGCHPGYDTREAMATATPSRMETCTDCHDAKRPLGCDGCHDNLDRLVPRTHGARNWQPVHGDFSKGKEIPGGRNDCKGCHGAKACRDCHRTNKPRSHDALWAGMGHGIAARNTMDRCRICHGRSACSDCHSKKKPSTHANERWAALHHSQAARVNITRCHVCHRQDYCDQCHAVSTPSDHDNHFRQTGHGLSVASDRERCRACHTVDFCVRCHAEVSPRSHTLGWNNPQNRHCLNCHWPPGSRGHNCTLCHKAFPGHAAQAPLSAAHASRPSNCAICHNGMHPVGDNACSDCHK